ncbi:serine--tRNA ligase [Candidatus Fermentibacterales bacterium]|nr:serine--tRNA ligase [Candidatus Fermentibacterales bacterium]
MLDRKLLRGEPDAVREACEAKREPCRIDEWARLDERRRGLLVQVENLRAERNTASELVAELRKKGQDAAEQIERNRSLAQAIKDLDEQLRNADEALESLELTFPNLPDADVPRGRDSSANLQLRAWGEPPDLGFQPRQHVELLGSLFDQDAAARISGANFILLRGECARLQRILISWMIDFHRRAGYEEIWPPFLALPSSMRATGQIPKLADDMYLIENDQLYLVPTGEVPLTNICSDTVLEETRLPLALTAYTPCFRREAGSYGRETRGLNRVHQFEKVELVRIERPDRSDKAHEEMVAHVESMLRALELPYRAMLLSTGDLSFAAARCVDLEIWAAGQGAWLEVSSVSNFRDFQARRARIRYRPSSGGKPVPVHTLNGSGLALPRLILALVENNQLPDGRIRLPAILAELMGAEFLIG